ncbi:quinone oxidoreductase-like protein 1 isoform X3 [Parambassis ranga]|uniref:Quinone oxidoreductase-like protein 1 isoform X3 n=1 Tax=Parambassis ranga TaxID=210632 RepID=A0A6P7JSL6_9TELE|nr:quinone oxidoreductase-like protein 1 isoform X3 [Parambassis ranga]
MKGLFCRAGVSDAEPKFVIQETNLPEVLGSHQVRVQVKACGLSQLDLKLLSDVGIQRDLIPVGREVAGVVLQVGPKVTFFQPEDEVAGILPLDSPCSGLCEVIDIEEHYLARVIPVYKSSSDLLSEVLEETGGLGVDLVIDSGVRLHEAEEDDEEKKLFPHKHDIISVLGVGGHWVTSQHDLQLDPPDCRLLYLKSASVSFLNPEVWTASSAQQGRYLHILKDIVEKMSAGVLRPQAEEAVPLYEATVAMETVQRHQKKKAVVQL